MIIGLSGYAQTGKDTIANYLVEKYNFTRVAFADPIRNALYNLNPIIFINDEYKNLVDSVDEIGWEETKRLSNNARELLQRLGTEVGRAMFGNDFWVNQAMLRAKEHENVVISDVRYVNEANAIENNGGVVWRIYKPGILAINQHESEKNLDDYLFKVNIKNDSDFVSLYKVVDKHMSMPFDNNNTRLQPGTMGC